MKKIVINLTFLIFAVNCFSQDLMEIRSSILNTYLNDMRTDDLKFINRTSNNQINHLQVKQWTDLRKNYNIQIDTAFIDIPIELVKILELRTDEYNNSTIEMNFTPIYGEVTRINKKEIPLFGIQLKVTRIYKFNSKYLMGIYTRWSEKLSLGNLYLYNEEDKSISKIKLSKLL